MSRAEQVARRTNKVMAYDRQTFKARVMEKIDGSLGHFYMATVARRNGQTRWVEHWLSEVNRLLFIELVVVLRKPIKGRWERRKAVDEVVQELRDEDAGHRRAAEGAIQRYYGLKKLNKRVPTEATAEFYRMVRDAVDEGLSPVRAEE